MRPHHKGPQANRLCDESTMEKITLLLLGGNTYAQVAEQVGIEFKKLKSLIANHGLAKGQPERRFRCKVKNPGWDFAGENLVGVRD